MLEILNIILLYLASVILTYFIAKLFWKYDPLYFGSPGIMTVILTLLPVVNLIWGIIIFFMVVVEWIEDFDWSMTDRRGRSIGEKFLRIKDKD
jgi:hypothetical protein